jgi:glycosyltransferase involved in cell wall biosynthesis
VKEEKNISVIVINHNKDNILQECIKSISEQLKEKDELILIDNNSNDYSQKIMQHKFENDNLIHRFFLKENLGVSNGRNFGAQKATNNLLMFVDSDLILGSYSIEKARESIDQQTDVILGEYHDIGTGYVWFREMQRNTFSRKRKKIKNTQITYKNFFTFSGGLCVIKKNIFLEFNGYNHAFYKSPAEDIDFELRLLKENKIIRLERKFCGIHEKGNISLKSLFKSIKYSAKGVAYLCKSAKINKYKIPFNRYHPRIPLIHFSILCALFLLFFNFYAFFTVIFINLCYYYLPVFLGKRTKWKNKWMSLYLLPITDTIWLYCFIKESINLMFKKFT